MGTTHASPRGPGPLPAAPPLPLLPGAVERLSRISVGLSASSALPPQIGPTAAPGRHQQRLQLAGAQLRGQRRVLQQQSSEDPGTGRKLLPPRLE